MENFHLDNSDWYDRLINKTLDEYHDDTELAAQLWEKAEKKIKTSGTSSSESKTKTV
jgi:hypothetical protein|tara:strand:+ start:1751 stop:1921 length:171 start_codon:yes stop_codon:yes gene_type:complete